MNGVRRYRNAKRLLMIGSLVLVVLGSFGLALALLRGGEGNPSTAQKPSASSKPLPVRGFEASEVFYFDSLDKLVATSDLVVVGTVTDVRTGRVIPDPAGEYPTRYLNTTVRIEEVLKGPAPAGGVVTVEGLEAAYGPPTEWRKPGTRMLLFLWRGTEPETQQSYYATTNYSQSAYVLQNNDLVATVKEPDEPDHPPLNERVASLSLPELRLRVEEAKLRIASGEVTDLPEVR